MDRVSVTKGECVASRRADVDHSSYLDFAKSESGAAVLLVIAAAAALIWANSPWAESYFHLRDVEFAAQFYEYTFTIDLLHFVDDFLMMFFFLVIGLEVKRELLLGELSSPKDAILPFVAAVAASSSCRSRYSWHSRPALMLCTAGRFPWRLISRSH